MADAYIAIGSNIAPADNVRRAVELLAAEVRLTAVSTVYLTPAEGRPEQASYYNCVVAVRTELPAERLKAEVLRRIEERLGRVRSADKFAPRTIDLDLLVYDQLAVDSAELKLPDPQILTRPFVTVPLAELAPDLVLPRRDARMASLAANLPRDRMIPLTAYSRQLQALAEEGADEAGDEPDARNKTRL
jgi:2-amino-4-hydroxy-6-hydroxymethyldihydropteridine diphosphokinase